MTTTTMAMEMVAVEEAKANLKAAIEDLKISQLYYKLQKIEEEIRNLRCGHHIHHFVREVSKIHRRWVKMKKKYSLACDRQMRRKNKKYA